MRAVIDQAEVRRIAKLARLSLSDEEVRRFAGQLASILDYFEQIETLNTEGVEPLTHALPVANVLREDEVGDGLPHQQALANAPESERDWFRVPAVLDRQDEE